MKHNWAELLRFQIQGPQNPYAGQKIGNIENFADIGNLLTEHGMKTITSCEQTKSSGAKFSDAHQI